MFRIRERSALDVLNKIAKLLEGETSSDFHRVSMTIDNEYGKGTITAYTLFPSLAALIFNIEFYTDLIFDVDEEFMDTLYFIFCLKGNLEHKFGEEDTYRKINFQQNVILGSSVYSSNNFRFPKDQKVECSFIHLLRQKTDDKDIPGTYLRSGINEIMEEIGTIDSYRFFGQVRPQTSVYLDRIINTGKKGVVGRLLVEASILSILALQIEYHEQEKESPTVSVPLKQDEIERILALSETIIESLDQSLTIKDLSNISSLNSKKLQTGFRYLFGVSANSYIKNVRMERALEMIQTTDLSISEIVYKVGLSSRSYFTRIFYERYGYNPSDYKKLISGTNN